MNYPLPEVSRILRITLEAAECRLAGSQMAYTVGSDGVKRLASHYVPAAMGIAPHEWRAAVLAAVGRAHSGI